MPSISPMTEVLTPSTLNRNSGTRFSTISLEMSVKNEVRLSAQMLRGRAFSRSLIVQRGYNFHSCRLPGGDDGGKGAEEQPDGDGGQNPRERKGIPHREDGTHRSDEQVSKVQPAQ